MPNQKIDDRSGQQENMSDSEKQDQQRKNPPEAGNRNNERESQDQSMNPGRNQGQRGKMPGSMQQEQEEKVSGDHGNPFPGDERDIKDLERKRSSDVEIDDEDGE